MKEKFLALITVAIISAPTLFAFHDEDASLLTAGMPVVFIATGFKFLHNSIQRPGQPCRLYMLQNPICPNDSTQI